MSSMRTASRLLAATLLCTTGCGARIVGGSSANSLTVGGTAHGELTPSTPSMMFALRSTSTQFPADVWTVDLVMGEPVTIAMCEDAGVDIDPYLIMDSNGLDPHGNDDSAGGYHGHGSLVAFTPTMTGPYTVYASTFRTSVVGPGNYTLHVFAGLMSTFRCPS